MTQIQRRQWNRPPARRPRPRTLRARIGWLLVHCALVGLWLAVQVGLVLGGGVLIVVGWPDLWAAEPVMQVIGGALLIIVGIAVFLVVPDRIERFTGIDVGGADASGGF
ncbi:hypothetical protein AAFP35_23830 [Gordonia sp. CPCC 206044]|uniref:hypothetical protein n=1 Tax=Gordonia sp. CPCC 206044 TaxID=3140793 RepID=UPI003AF397CC